MAGSLSRDEARTAGLLFGEELALGLVAPDALDDPAVRRAVRGGPVPSPLSRRFQRAQMRRGRLTYASHVVAPLMAARRALLGDGAQGRPKLLIRVDGFPHHRAGDEPGRYPTADAAAFHAVLRDAGVPYLMAVLPRVPLDAENPSGETWRAHDEAERDLLAELRRDGVAFGVHGLDHRPAKTHPRRRAEPGGKHAAKRLDSALATLREDALHADVFVPPYERFDPAGWPALAQRFDVVCGGPDSVDTMGFHLTPSWRGNTIWLPSLAPLNGPAADVLPAVRDLLAQETSLWIPITLRWDRERDDGYAALRALAALVAEQQLARSWDDFLLAARASHHFGAAAG